MDLFGRYFIIYSGAGVKWEVIRKYAETPKSNTSMYIGCEDEPLMQARAVACRSGEINRGVNSPPLCRKV